MKGGLSKVVGGKIAECKLHKQSKTSIFLEEKSSD